MGGFDASALRSFAQGLSRIALIAAATGGCTYANPAWSAFTGLEEEHSAGNGWQLALHPGDLNSVLDLLAEGRRRELPFEIRCRMRSADGVYAMFAMVLVPLREQNGAIASWLVVCDRADLESAADDRFRQLADALPIMMWTVDRADRLTFVNRAWMEYTGLPAGSTIEERNALAHPADLPVLMKALRRGESEVTFRIRRRSDGMFRWHYLRWVHTHSGNLPFFRIGTAMDIHDQRAARDERDRQMRVIAEALPDLVFSTTPDGAQDYANSAMLAYTGMTAEECVGGVWARFTHSADWIETRDRWQRSMRSGEPYEMEHRLLRRDGSARWFLTRALPMRDESGTIVRWFGTSTDIHTQKRVAQEQTYLAELGRIVNSSLELDRTLRHICEAAVPLFAHSCQIDLLVDGVVRTAAFAYTGEQHEVSPSRIRAHFYGDARAASFVERGDGQSTETVIVPMHVRGKSIGTISFVRPEDSEAYGSADIAFLEEVARRCALAIQNAQLYQREHRVATALQAASLPRRLPQIEGLVMDAVYVPGQHEAQIGGDWYDAFALPDGRVVVSIGDVAGSGLDAAVTMGSMRQIIRGIAQIHADPILMLNSADRALRLDDPDRFVTAFVGVIDPVASTMIYASAGHPPPFIRRASGELVELPSGDLPLGLRERLAGEPRTINIVDGDLLVLYTDGLIESERDLMTGTSALRNALADAQIDQIARPALFIQERVLADAARDDVAVLTLRLDRAQRISGQRRWTFASLDPTGLSQMRREFRSALIEYALSDLHLESAELVLGELAGNVVRHAPGTVEIVLDRSGSEIVLHVIDEGPGFTRTPMLPIDVMSESGRGLFIVSQMTKDFSVTRRHPRGSHARAVLQR